MYFEIDENNIEQWEKPQIKESKRAFFYATITEAGDKEKLECFVDFCEDAIFEMQHAESLMSTAEEGGAKKVSQGPTLPDEDQPRGIIAPLKENVAKGKEAAFFYLSYLHPSNLKAAAAKARTMTALELALVLLTSAFWFVYGMGFLVIKIGGGISSILLFLMRGEKMGGKGGKKKGEEEERGRTISAIIPVADAPVEVDGAGADGKAPGQIEGEEAKKEEKKTKTTYKLKRYGHFLSKLKALLFP